MALRLGIAAGLLLLIPPPADAYSQETGGFEAVAVDQVDQEARLTADGLAVPPIGAPEQVKDVIRAGNRIAKKPYRYGGGHGRWRDTGYDCSGSVSYALHGGDLLDAPMASGGFMDWGEEGEGEWITVYAHGSHMFMVVAGLRFDTSGQRRTGSRWQRGERSTDGFVARHPAGL